MRVSIDEANVAGCLPRAADQGDAAIWRISSDAAILRVSSDAAIDALDTVTASPLSLHRAAPAIRGRCVSLHRAAQPIFDRFL